LSTTKTGALRRTFTIVIKSFNGGPSSNKMEDANTKAPSRAPWADRVLCNQIEDE